MMQFTDFSAILAQFARTDNVKPDDVLFGAGLDLASVAFLEFILELETVTGRDIDVETLDASIITAGQLHERLFP
ncbi:MAG: acyl carrier protein [Fuscovulum sp.]|jgi:acyl carrier protein|nr:acyl carrier protein [Fuscovulum sp.]